MGEPLTPIPVASAEKIAKQFGYDQVIIIARKVGSGDEQHGEHCTTYGVDDAHCDAAARIGDFFKYKLMRWERPDTASRASGAERVEGEGA